MTCSSSGEALVEERIGRAKAHDRHLATVEIELRGIGDVLIGGDVSSRRTKVGAGSA